MFSGLQRELINTYVIEAIHKSPGYVYGKQLWFVDPEKWVILFYPSVIDLKVFENTSYLSSYLSPLNVLWGIFF